MMQKIPTVRCDRAGALATVTLDRPQALNALDAATLQALRATVDDLAGSAEVRVILLTGAGDRAFAAGADIRELLQTDAETGRALSNLGQAAFRTIESCGKPVIACVNGAALGGGFELALACTLRFAGETAKFGLPEAKLGLVPGFGGIQRLVRCVGRSAALRLMLTGETIPAAEALRFGAVDAVLSPEHLMPAARQLGSSMAQLAPLAIQGILEAVHRQDDLASAAARFHVENEIFSRLCASADKQEGLSAFLEKRPPVWQGR